MPDLYRNITNIAKSGGDFLYRRPVSKYFLTRYMGNLATLREGELDLVIYEDYYNFIYHNADISYNISVR